MAPALAGLLTPLYLHNAPAAALVDVPLVAWLATDAYIRWRNRAIKKTLEWSFFVVFGSIAAGLVLGFRSEHVESAVIAGGWAPVVVGTVVLIAGAAARAAQRGDDRMVERFLNHTERTHGERT